MRPRVLRIAFWLATVAASAAMVVALMAFLERVRIGLEIGDFVVGVVVGTLLGPYLLLVVETCRGRGWARRALPAAAVLVIAGLIALFLSGVMPLSLLHAAALAGALPLVSVMLMWLPAASAFIREEATN